MSEITLTPAMRANLLSLKGTARLMDLTQARIASGRKVNSALDGPLPYFTALGLTNKASDLSTLKDAMGQGISTINAADQALTAITDLVDQMKGLTASAKAASTTSERSALAAQFDDLRSQIDKLAADATYSGKNLVAGGGTITGGTWADAVSFDLTNNISAEAISGSGSETEEITFNVEVQGEYGDTETLATSAGDLITAGTLIVTTGTDSIGTGGWTNVDLDAGDITLTVSGSNVVISDGTNSVTVAQADIEGNGSIVNLTLGELDVTLTTTVAITIWSANSNNTVIVIDSTDLSSTRLKVSANGQTEYQVTSGGSFNVTNSAWSNSFDFTALAAKDGTVGETATYTRTNTGGVAENDMKVFFNEDNSAFVQTSAVDVTSNGLSLSAAASDWASDANIDSAVTDITAAIDSLRSNAQAMATSLGIIQTREEFTEEFINVLLGGGDKLTLADNNEEAANMLALQTRQQLGIQSLSMASQSASSILALFR